MELDEPAVEESEERRDLCRRMCEAVRDGDDALAWKLAREYCGLPPEAE